MIKRALISLLVLLAIGIASLLILGLSWSRTEHGILDYRAAIGLKLHHFFSGDPVLNAAQLREEAVVRARLLQGRSVAIAKIEEVEIPGPRGEIPARIYRPVENGPLPALLFYHGGGWVIGNLDTNDDLCRKLSKKASAVVVSVDYRLAPEHRFPAALDDSYAALEWVFRNAGELKVDRSRIAVAGGSAGGNLAAAVALMARDRAGPRLIFQVLFYPATDLFELATPSHAYFADGYGLTAEHIEFFRESYLPDVSDRSNPYASPLRAASLKGLPPAMVVTAGFDVLRDEGIAYAERLRADGVATISAHYPGMIHGFVPMGRLFGEADEAIDEAAAALSEAFGEGARHESGM
jgi:acetyl esterase